MKIYVKHLTINNYQKFLENSKNKKGFSKLSQNNKEKGGEKMRQEKYDKGVSIKIDRKTKALLDEYKDKMGATNAATIRIAVAEFLKEKLN